jgi:fumarate reductase flavoprotein subunit
MAQEQHPEHEYDVVVIGAGMAGICAAIAASEAGVSVLILEKMAEPGGSTVWSGGAFAFAGTPEQEQAGIVDNEHLLFKDLTSAGPGRNHAGQVGLYVSRQRDTSVWLRRLGIEFGTPVLSPGQSVPRSICVDIRLVMKQLQAEFAKYTKGTLWIKANAQRLHRDADGRVSKVMVDVNGVAVTIRAHRGVVIATGGFARGNALVTRFAPELEATKRLGGEGVTGDGIRMGWALGGDLMDAGWLEGTFGAILPHYPSPTSFADNDTILLHAEYSGAIIVNKEGRRFVNESLTYRKLGLACLRQTDAIAFQIFDQSIMEQSRAVPFTRNFKTAFERGGLIRRADSIGAAASAMGLSAGVVEQTAARYNAGIDAGCDVDFGRTSLLSGHGIPVRIERAPFYIYACTTAIVSTYAGLVGNERMELMDIFGEPVPGVFVAGEVVGGLHGPIPMSGTALGKAAIFGRTAGENAAAGQT